MTDHVPKSFADHSVDTHERRHGPQEGPYVYLMVRHNGTILGCEETRHEAIGELTKRVAGPLTESGFDCADDYEIRYVPVQNAPFADMRYSAGSEVEE